jgi:hypothetical protein
MVIGYWLLVIERHSVRFVLRTLLFSFSLPLLRTALFKAYTQIIGLNIPDNSKARLKVETG